MNTFFILLSLLALILLSVGLVKPSTLKLPNRKRVIGWYGGGFLVLCVLIGATSSPNSTPTSTDTSSTAVKVNPQPVVSSSVSVGTNGYLNNGQPQVLVATTKESEDALIKASVANDTTGMTEIVMAHGAFFVDKDTKVLVIESALGVRKVRILEGEFVQQIGWVPKEFVRAAK